MSKGYAYSPAGSVDLGLSFKKTGTRPSHKDQD